MILADTSIWVDHLRRGNAKLAEHLAAGEVACHPFVVGELACGNLANRAEILSLLRALPALPTAQNDELLAFIERTALMGRGLGLIDMHLLASCMLASTPLWTGDARLARAAGQLGFDARQ
jgi:predicted nucleic acid-binding protein